MLNRTARVATNVLNGAVKLRQTPRVPGGNLSPSG